MVETRVYPDRAALARAAAGQFIGLAELALKGRRAFRVALAGGSTPAAAYTLLAEEAHNLDWSQIHIFWSDERCVPPDHPDSNYRIARETLLDRLLTPPENVHRMRGELPPQAGADEYERLLRQYFGQPGTVAARRRYSFDLVWLGLGVDGHTASLFPGSPVLDEMRRWSAAVEHDQPPPPLVARLTLTLPAINAARQVIISVTGKEKAQILQRVMAAPAEGEPRLPAQRIRPLRGNLTWLVDAEVYSASHATA